jgi:hypothetical protein
MVRFEGVTEVELGGLNEQNVLFDVTFGKRDDVLGTSIFSPVMASAASFVRCDPSALSRPVRSASVNSMSRLRGGGVR